MGTIRRLYCSGRKKIGLRQRIYLKLGHVHIAVFVAERTALAMRVSLVCERKEEEEARAD